MKKILILGGTGFLGQNIVKRLAKDNLLIVTGRNTTKVFQHPNISYRKLDFTSCMDFSDLLQDIDLVIHLISTINPSDDLGNIRQEICDNILPTLKLLDDMVRKNVPEILFMSSGGAVYGEYDRIAIKEDALLSPICNYGIMKVLIEQYLQLYARNFSLNYKIVRLANPYSDTTKADRSQGIIPLLVDKILDHEMVTIWGDGEAVRDFIFIDDAIDAIEHIISYQGETKIFNVGTGIGCSLNNCVDIIKRQSGIDDISVRFINSRKCDVRNNILDISRATVELDWKPKISLDVGIRKVLNRKIAERNLKNE